MLKVLLSVVMLLSGAQNVARRYDVVSIKRCDSATPAERSPVPESSPERFVANCLTVSQLINSAYVHYADGRTRSFAQIPVSGGPGWIESDRYRIDARADGPARLEMMRGPMLQALLVDRFKLKIREVTKEIPVYAITAAPGGTKLEPTKASSCISMEEERKNPHAAPQPGEPRPPLICGLLWRDRKGSEIMGVTLRDFATHLALYLDRPVIDRTGVAGAFDIRMDLTYEDLDEKVSPAGVTDLPQYPVGAIRSALAKLGLNLQSSRGPGKSLIIDSVQRATEN